MVVIPLVLIFSVPLPSAEGGTAILEYIMTHRAVYLTELLCFVGLSIPALGVFLAVLISLRNANKSLAALGGLVGIVSEIIALSLASSPQSLSAGLVYLSDQYANATSGVQQSALSAAAEGFLANANAVSSAVILTALGILLLSICMLHGVYSPRIAILGIVTGVIGIVFEAFRPQIGMLYALYGTLLPIWFVAVGLRLFKLGFKNEPEVL